ncbi:MAG: HEAT repeat domain-containing protein [Planctomycetes bacterium]|nr:HEAT repeat domain-containing protein [Planctomycetota bacterium]
MIRKTVLLTAMLLAMILFLQSDNINQVLGWCPSAGDEGNTLPPPGPPPEQKITPTPTPTPASRPGPSTGLEPKVFNPPTNTLLAAWEIWWIRNRLNHLPFKEPVKLKEEIGDGNETQSVSLNAVKEIIDTLADALKNDKNPLAQAMAALALGKFREKNGLPYLKEAMMHPNYDVKNTAYLALGIYGDTTSIDAIKTFLFSSDSTEISKSYAALALGYIKDPAATEALKDVLKQDKKTPINVTCSAILSLGNLQEKSAIALLSGILTDTKKTLQERAYAALALGRIKEPEVLPELRKALSDKTGAIRASVAIALGLLKTPDAKKDILNLLQSDKDSSVLEFASIALAQLGDKTAYDPLVQLISSKKTDYMVKGFCIIALGIIGDEKSAAKLRELLADKKERLVRPAVIVALGILKDKKSVQPLINTVKNEQYADPVSFIYAIQALGMIGDEQAVPPLEALYKKAQEDLNIANPVYNNLTVALCMLGKKKEVLEILHKHLKEKKAPMQILQRAAHGLAYVGNKESVDTLIKAYKNEQNMDLRMYIIFALGFILDVQKVNPLYALTADTNYNIWLNIMDHIAVSKPD